MTERRVEVVPIKDAVITIRGAEIDAAVGQSLADATGRTVLWLGEGIELGSLDDDQMRDAGWLRDRRHRRRD